MSTLGKLSRIESEFKGFEPYLTILTTQYRVHFLDTFEESAGRFLSGKITARDFGGIVGELCRDAKGTAQTCQRKREDARKRTMIAMVSAR